MGDDMADDAPHVTRNDSENRYELWLDDTVVGHADFTGTESGTAFMHTVVDDAYEGRGFGSVLAKAALDDTIERDEIIVPYCPFIQAYLKRHHEYDAHVAWPTPKHEKK